MNALTPQTSSQSLPLRDIHLPDPVSAWPPATGWWVLLALIIIIFLALFLYKKYKPALKRKPAYKKLATNEFQAIKKQFAGNPSVELLRALSTLTRQITLSYYPRQQVASLTGEAWLQQIKALSGEHAFNQSQAELLLQAPYRQQVDFNADEILSAFEQWLKHLPETDDELTDAELDVTGADNK